MSLYLDFKYKDNLTPKLERLFMKDKEKDKGSRQDTSDSDTPPEKQRKGNSPKR